MLRLSDRGIPPHMLHLYEVNADTPSKSIEHNDDAVRLPSVLLKLGSAVAAGLKSMQSKPTDDFLPDSAKSARNKRDESQYLGQTSVRDTRWTPNR
ncbi:hypothetical protein [Amylibacter sp. IMCC11727]|uniref:hypothetical protein n=1 Tax=Amylibacter sp. IMCC11727 TaxID=3039851 RepID=UPI00244E06B5|nr:hypothetical protein [Amylibacter sp. IMCC11727]WGI21007.1 hypothetical protein QBD29_12935 [Amylibacter sp. IMCC11727]